jgi:hypothetical protein
MGEASVSKELHLRTRLATRVLGPVIRHGPLLLCRAFGETLYRYVA